MSLNDSHKSMVELANSRNSKEAGRTSWIGKQKDSNSKSGFGNQHRRTTSQTGRKSNHNNKEMKDGEINSIREKADRANTELGEAVKSRAGANKILTI